MSRTAAREVAEWLTFQALRKRQAGIDSQNAANLAFAEADSMDAMAAELLAQEKALAVAAFSGLVQRQMPPEDDDDDCENGLLDDNSNGGPVTRPEVEDLMEALQASVEAARAKRAERERHTPPAQ